MEVSEWSKSSWRSFPIQQQPHWQDSEVCEDVLYKLTQLPALVFAGETRALKEELAEVIDGKAFVLQAGDCAEDFARCNGPIILMLFRGS